MLASSPVCKSHRGHQVGGRGACPAPPENIPASPHHPTSSQLFQSLLLISVKLCVQSSSDSVLVLGAACSPHAALSVGAGWGAPHSPALWSPEDGGLWASASLFHLTEHYSSPRHARLWSPSRGPDMLGVPGDPAENQRLKALLSPPAGLAQRPTCSLDPVLPPVPEAYLPHPRLGLWLAAPAPPYGGQGGGLQAGREPWCWGGG